MNTVIPSRRRASHGFRPLLLAACVAVPALAALPASAQFIPTPGPNLVPETLTREDVTALSAASAKLYTAETVAVGAVETWTNPKTGNSGVVTIARVFERNGMPCREIVHRIKLAREGEQTYHFNRCRIGTGEWKLIG